MFALFLGRTGSGKSYEMTRYHVLPALQSGRMVVTNLPLQVDTIYSYFPETRGLIKLIHPTKLNPRPFSTVTDFIHDWRDPETNQGPLIIIDEAHKAFPRGKTSLDVLEFMAESRHAGVDIYYATQGTRKIDGNVLDLTDITYRFIKARMFGTDKKYIRKVVDGVRGDSFDTDERAYDSKYYKFYQSHTMSNKAVAEASAADVKSIWRHWSVYGAAACGLFAIVAIFQGWLNPFKVMDATAAQVTEVTYIPEPPPMKLATQEPEPLEQPETTQLEQKAAVIEPAKPTHPYSKVMFHVAGGINDETHNLALISASQNGQSVFLLPSTELERAGYRLSYLAECSIFIEYPASGYSEYLTCNAPSQTVIPASNT